MRRYLPARVLEEFLERFSNGKIEYKAREQKKIDWSSYNRARIKCLENVLYMIKVSVDSIELEEPVKKQGRPCLHSAHDKAKAVLLAELFQADERTASALVSLFKEKLGIENEMSPRTIGRAYYDARVRYILTKILEKSNAYVSGKAKSFSGDSTGMKRKLNESWIREKEQNAKNFDMLSIIASNEFHVISAYSLDLGPIGDAQKLKKLVSDTLALHPKVKEMQFDAAYLSRANVQFLADNGIEPYIMVRKNCTLKARGCKAWHDMLWKAVTEPSNFLRHYHMRSNIEAVNSCLKRTFLRPLMRKELAGRRTEILSRIVLHNFIQLNTAHYEGRINIFSAE